MRWGRNLTPPAFSKYNLCQTQLKLGIEDSFPHSRTNTFCNLDKYILPLRQKQQQQDTTSTCSARSNLFQDLLSTIDFRQVWELRLLFRIPMSCNVRDIYKGVTNKHCEQHLWLWFSLTCPLHCPVRLQRSYSQRCGLRGSHNCRCPTSIKRLLPIMTTRARAVSRWEKQQRSLNGEQYWHEEVGCPPSTQVLTLVLVVLTPIMTVLILVLMLLALVLTLVLTVSFQLRHPWSVGLESKPSPGK